MAAVPGQAFICLFAGMTGQPFTSGRHLFLADTFSPPDLLFATSKGRKSVRFSLFSRRCGFFLPGLFVAVGADCIIFIQPFVSQKERLYNSLCNETYKIATLNAVQVLGVEEEYKKATEETEDWMKPENCFPNLYQDNKE